MSLGFFTTPYPDELLYSACARYSDRTQYPNSASAIQELFGRKSAVAVIDLPSRINYLILALPPQHSYTADRIIDHHTLAPFYAPFLPFERMQLLREDMKQTSAVSHTHERAGITSTTIKTPRYLRFCPLCTQEDIDHFGEKYWHRVHQIPMVDLCPTHTVFVENSNALWQVPNNPSKLVSANEAIPTLQPRHFDKTDPHQIHLLKIARDVTWLLNWHGHNSDIRFLRERYYNLLLKRGLAYYNGRIKTYELSEELVQFFSQEFLRQLQSEITNFARGWVYRLVHTNTLKVAQHPIRHLLLITFLGYTAEEFFTASDEFKPFGAGPWPCLNQASDHYKKSVIPACQTTDNLVKKKRGRPMGTFSCNKCGFIYNRVGPDTTEASRFQANSIQVYGPIWEIRLRELWKDTFLSLGEVGRKLGVSALTVVRYAIRLGLPMNIPNSRQVSKKTIQRYSSFRPLRNDALEHYRREWLTITNTNPEATRKELIALANFLYLWLRKNDAEWIEAHLPPARQERSKKPRVNWEKVDSELSKEVIKTIARIKNLTGKPVRASLAELIREIGHKTYLEQRLDKLPITANALGAHLESLEEFAIRKIKWAESCFQQEGRCPTRLQLIVRAVVVNKTGRTRTVQSAIDAAMERLRKDSIQEQSLKNKLVHL